LDVPGRLAEDPTRSSANGEQNLHRHIGYSAPRGNTPGSFPDSDISPLHFGITGPQLGSYWVSWRYRHDLFQKYFSNPENNMPKYIIERDIPGAGKMSDDQLRDVAQKSCDVLRKLGPQIQWRESYVTDDKIYCVYIAPDEDIVRQHAREGGFPANRVSEVRKVIDPTTAELAPVM
jgi:hypothetical protein